MTSTFKELLTTYNPDNSKRLLSRVTNVNLAIKANTPSVSAISRAFGDLKAEAMIKLWLINLNAVTSVNSPLSELQINEIAFYIVSDYRNLTIADLHVIFTNAKKGKYGSFYENLSLDKVMSWVNEYNLEREQAYANNSYQQHMQQKESGSEPRNSETTVKGLMDEIKRNEKK